MSASHRLDGAMSRFYFDECDMGKGDQAVASIERFPELEKIPVLIHVGLHKTGTTWLQKKFFPYLENVVYVDNVEMIHSIFLTPRFGDFDVARVMEVFRPYIMKAFSAGQPLLISDEALGGRPFHQKFVREITALRLQRAFPNARILVTIREQEALVRSFYGEYLRYGYASSLREFLNQDLNDPNIHPILDLAFYEFDRLFSFYRAVFGTRNVDVIPSEWLLADNAAFASRLGALLGTAMRAPAGIGTSERERPAWSGWARRYQQFANRLSPQDSRASRKPGRLSANSVAYWIDRVTPGWARRATAERERQLVREMIGQYYVHSNRRFAEMAGFDLGALGYRV